MTQSYTQPEGSLTLSSHSSEWPEVLSKYLDWMRVTHYSADTIHVRGLYLKYFITWAQERGITGPGEVTSQILERYQRWLYHYRKKSDAPLSVWSQHGRLVAIKGFFRWLARQRPDSVSFLTILHPNLSSRAFLGRDSPDL